MVLDYICCDALEDRDSRSEGSITCSTDEGILECDYDTQVTKLYHSIEERQWEEVLYFLETSNWYNTSIFSAFGEQGDGPPVQARTWVTALDDNGNVRWCQLPLHAAVTFLAPFSVISKLVEVFPKSVRCADDQDMLPLHYAFRFGAEDDVLLLLLEKFPQAVGKKAVKDRLPLDLAQYGPRPERGSIIDHYMQGAVRNAKSDWDGEYERMVTSMRQNADAHLEEELAVTSEKLAKTMTELSKAKKDLQAMKRENNVSSNASVKSTRSLRRSASYKSTSSKRSVSRKKTSTVAMSDSDDDTAIRAPKQKRRPSHKEGGRKEANSDGAKKDGSRSNSKSKKEGSKHRKADESSSIAKKAGKGIGKLFGFKK